MANKRTNKNLNSSSADVGMIDSGNTSRNIPIPQHYGNGTTGDDGNNPITVSTPSSGGGQQQPNQPQQQRSSTTNPEVAICCGCRPKRRRRRRCKKYSLSKSVLKMVGSMRGGRYFDASRGPDTEWKGGGAAASAVVAAAADDDDSLFYFDAVDRPLGDEEYPVDGGGLAHDGGRYIVRSPSLGNYPIVFTTSLQHPAPHVSLNEPETMLRRLSEGTLEDVDGQKRGGEEVEGGGGRIDEEKDQGVEVWSSEPINSHQESSLRLLRIRRRPTIEHTVRLATPRVKIREKGYPGGLTQEELTECEKFLRGLKQMEDTSLPEQVYSFRDIEEEPYTICRWLRATKFDSAKILQRLADNQKLFDEAKVHEFYPDVDTAIGAPVSVFLSQYPFLAVGRGKNGCPINYFQAGKINPEGILCMTTVDRLRSYFWNTFMWKFKSEIRQAQAADPDFVRIEGINIVDLTGLSASAMTSETMEVIKVASKISDFFPETLHCMLVLNAPGFFALSWGLIKKFLDPRTAARIQIFANVEKGQRALEKLVDRSQLPTDYGGGNISLKSAFLMEAADDTILRQEIELIHCKRNGKAQTKAWVLDKDESMEITIYTRSVSMANVFVKLNDSTFKTVQAGCQWVDGPASTKTLPNRVVAVSKHLVGPGTVTVEVSDLDTAEKKHSGLSRGYFLVVGDVKSVQPDPIPSPVSDTGSPTKTTTSSSQQQTPAGMMNGGGRKRKRKRWMKLFN